MSYAFHLPMSPLWKPSANTRGVIQGLAFAGLICTAPIVFADDAEDLAKKLSNPVAALISVPFQYNYDHHYGDPETGHRSLMNIQPVVPISLNADWNVISRTIIPIIDQNNVVPGSHQTGVGDVLQSLFFSPKAPTASGLIWGLGPAFSLPTGSDDKLSSRKWGIGPTGVLLRQDGPYTYGMLANHIWGSGGDSDRSNVSSTFIQPFFSYTTKTAWSFTVNTESSYDWKGKEWSVPVNGMVSKLVKFGDQAVSIGGGVRYWADTTDAGPHDLGYRFIVTFLFPK